MPSAPTHHLLGTDLALTRYSGTTGSAPLDAADSWGTVDLRVAPGGHGGLASTTTPHPLDLAAVSGRDNLGQALVMRLLTPRGALAPLGHPEYGSRLVELIGRPNNDATRNLARLHTLEAVGQEPRVQRLLNLTVTPAPGQPNTLAIHFAVLPLQDDSPLALTLEVTL